MQGDVRLIYQNCPERFRTLHQASSWVVCKCKDYFLKPYIYIYIYVYISLVGRSTLKRSCIGIHEKSSLMSFSLVFQQCLTCLVFHTWIVYSNLLSILLGCGIRSNEWWHPVRLELTIAGLQVKLSNHYTIRGSLSL